MSGFTNMWSSFNSADVDKAASALKDGNPATNNIDGVDCHHMTASMGALSSLSAGSGSSDGTVDLWAANDGSRVCQLKLTTTDNTTNITIKWSNVNGTFNITAPPSQ